MIHIIRTKKYTVRYNSDISEVMIKGKYSITSHTYRQNACPSITLAE